MSLPAYGYSTHLMEELCGHPIPPLVNVGFCGLRSDAIDWDDVGALVQGIGRARRNVLLPRAGHDRDATRREAPSRSICERTIECFLICARAANPSAVLHHYVTKSKRAYFQHGWQRVQERGSSEAS